MANKPRKKVVKVDTPNELKFKGKNEALKLKYSMLKAMESSLCIVSTAAKKCHISRTLHYDWMESDENYKAAIIDLDNIALDFTESMMFQRIKEGSDQLIKYVMSTKGAKRGYNEKLNLEVSGKDGEAVKIDSTVTINVRRNREAE